MVLKLKTTMVGATTNANIITSPDYYNIFSVELSRALNRFREVKLAFLSIKFTYVLLASGLV